MVSLPLRVRQHGLDRVRIGAVDRGRATQVPLVLGRLLGKDVALERLRALYAAASAYAKALFGAAFGLHLGHDPICSICCPRRCSPVERLSGLMPDRPRA